MRRDVLELRAFYASPRGAAAREMLGRKVLEAWGDCSGLDVLGLGYATPFLDPLRPRARRVIAAMSAAQGVEVWRGGRGNLTVLADEFALPLANALFDRILCVHALEESESAPALLNEVCRVLAPSGRVIWWATSRTAAERSGSTPLTSTPWVRAPFRIMRSLMTNGAAPTTPSMERASRRVSS